MIRNYLVVAVRHMFRQKVHSFINIFGLSLGIALSILIFMFVRSEFSYDTFHENGDKIYRVNQKISGQNGTRFLSATPLPLCDALEDNYPEISHATRLGSSSMVVKNGENALNEAVTFVDADFFKMFSFPIITGNKQKPLLSLASMVLSKEAALKYFGSEDAIGKAMTIQMADRCRVFVVSAVADNMKDMSSIPFDFIIQIDNVRGFFPSDYFTSYKTAFIETFIQMAETTTQQDLESKFPLFVQRVIAVSDQDEAVELFMQPLTDIHLNSDLPETISQTSNRFYSFALAGLGVLVLFIACINFITLSLGKMTGRAKEVGIRKVVGALRAQLAQQYLGEALITTTFALGVALMIAQQTLPFFNSLSGKALVFTLDLSLILFLAALGLLLSVIAGSYPSILLSGFQPATVLKGVVKLGGKNFFSRGLVVLQFSLSTFLIIGTLVMRGQVEFFREKSLGYDQERVVDISMNNPVSPEAANRLFSRFRNEIINDLRIVSVSSAMNRFGIPWTRFKFAQDDGTHQSIFFNQVDHAYLKTMGVELLLGRNFSHEFSTDLSESIIVNEALVRHFGWQDPLNEQIPGRFERRHRIIGVAKDFHFTSLHQEVRPLILALDADAIMSGVTGLSTWTWPPQLNRVLVRIDAGETQPRVDFLKNSWAEVAPEAPFELTFLDDTIDAQYAEEQKWAKIINYSSVLAIIIACLGLFGLTTLAVEKRVKEVGIRKVLGASISSIASVLSKELLLLVAIANCFAWPLAYLASQFWLQDFAYRIDLSIWHFLFSSLLATGIALLTISSQTIKAALTNPVDSLRTE